jgi:3-oxoacyl-[acyl-carrier protein] reductase
MSRPFEGRVAVVTGGAKGIGRAIAIHLAAGGAKLVLAGRSEGPLEELKAEIQGQGGEAVAVRADVAVEADVADLCQSALDAFGKVEILVNNAGVTRDGLLLRMSDADWDQVIDTNLKGAFHCTRAFARPMVRQKWGRIVNIASVIGLIGNAGQTNYAASKAGLLGLTKAVAKELASRHITVNAVAPGFIETAMTDSLGEKVREGLMAQIPMGRLGKAEDVAQAVGFLCSEGAAYVTGQVLTVDGGMVM